MRTLTATALTVLALAGCGGGDDSTSTADPDAIAAEVEEVSACVSDAGYEIAGTVSSPIDANSPDTELILNVGDDQVFIAFYSDSDAAEAAEERVTTNTEQLGGVVDREGSVTIAYGTPPKSKDREAISGCAFG